MAENKTKNKTKKKKDDNKEVVIKNSELIQPLLSEKSYEMANTSNKYVFSIPLNMNKIEVRKLVEEIYDVNVISVNTITRPGKSFTDWQRNLKYRRTDTKKAVVTLEEGDKIDEFFNI